MDYFDLQQLCLLELCDRETLAWLFVQHFCPEKEEETKPKKKIVGQMSEVEF